MHALQRAALAADLEVLKAVAGQQGALHKVRPLTLALQKVARQLGPLQQPLALPAPLDRVQAAHQLVPAQLAFQPGPAAAAARLGGAAASPGPPATAAAAAAAAQAKRHGK